MRYGKEADVPPMSEEGMVRALWVCRLRAASVLPGMTGTGAPVTGLSLIHISEPTRPY